jgi:hypothetical protein
VLLNSVDVAFPIQTLLTIASTPLAVHWPCSAVAQQHRGRHPLVLLLVVALRVAALQAAVWRVALQTFVSPLAVAVLHLLLRVVLQALSAACAVSAEMHRLRHPPRPPTFAAPKEILAACALCAATLGPGAVSAAREVTRGPLV